MRKKNNIFYIVITIILLVIALLLNEFSYNRISEKKYDDGDSDKFISDERLKELFDNSYKYYLISQGRDENYDKVGYLNVDGVKYYKSLLFNSFEDIEKMVNNTFINIRRNDYYDNIFNNRKYISDGDGLYGDFTEYCENINVDFDDITTSLTKNNTMFIESKNVGVHAYFENGTWYLESPLHFCS